MAKGNVIISGGNRPFWQLVLASVFFTAAIYFFYRFFVTIDLYGESREVRGAVNALEAAVITFMGGLGSSVTRDYYFDFDNYRYKSVYRVGPFKKGKWQDFQNLEYISIFKNSKAQFEVNLWYNRNKHFNISFLESKKDAMEQGKVLAQKLQISLLDATKASNQKWIKLH